MSEAPQAFWNDTSRSLLDSVCTRNDAKGLTLLIGARLNAMVAGGCRSFSVQKEVITHLRGLLEQGGKTLTEPALQDLAQRIWSGFLTLSQSPGEKQIGTVLARIHEAVCRVLSVDSSPIDFARAGMAHVPGNNGASPVIISTVLAQSGNLPVATPPSGNFSPDSPPPLVYLKTLTREEMTVFEFFYGYNSLLKKFEPEERRTLEFIAEAISGDVDDALTHLAEINRKLRIDVGAVERSNEQKYFSDRPPEIPSGFTCTRPTANTWAVFSLFYGFNVSNWTIDPSKIMSREDIANHLQIKPGNVSANLKFAHDALRAYREKNKVGPEKDPACPVVDLPKQDPDTDAGLGFLLNGGTKEEGKSDSSPTGGMDAENVDGVKKQRKPIDPNDPPVLPKGHNIEWGSAMMKVYMLFYGYDRGKGDYSAEKISRQEIATRLGITGEQVKFHLQNIRIRLRRYKVKDQQDRPPEKGTESRSSTWVNYLILPSLDHIDLLTPTELKVFRYLYGYDEGDGKYDEKRRRTMDEAATHFDVSLGTIRNARLYAFQKLRIGPKENGTAESEGLTEETPKAARRGKRTVGSNGKGPSGAATDLGAALVRMLEQNNGGNPRREIDGPPDMEVADLSPEWSKQDGVDVESFITALTSDNSQTGVTAWCMYQGFDIERRCFDSALQSNIQAITKRTQWGNPMVEKNITSWNAKFRKRFPLVSIRELEVSKPVPSRSGKINPGLARAPVKKELATVQADNFSPENPPPTTHLSSLNAVERRVFEFFYGYNPLAQLFDPAERISLQETAASIVGTESDVLMHLAAIDRKLRGTGAGERVDEYVVRGPGRPKTATPAKVFVDHSGIDAAAEVIEDEQGGRKRRDVEEPTSGGANLADPLRKYMREAGKTPLLTPEQEIELAGRIKKGSKLARDHMIKANLRLVIHIAQDYAHYGMSLLDVIQEGNMGLMKAVERFDPNKGGKLSTYAAWWIKQSIKRGLSNQAKTIRLPVHMVDKISKLRRVMMSMSADLGREPTIDEIADEIGWHREKISLLLDAAKRPASLDAPVGEDNATLFGELVADDSAQAAHEVVGHREELDRAEFALDVLDERERKIIDARFGLEGQKPKTLEEIGQEFGVTRERIRQLEGIALKKMRRKLEKDPRSPAERAKAARKDSLPRGQSPGLAALAMKYQQHDEKDGDPLGGEEDEYNLFS